MASFIEALREAGGRKRARITEAQRAEVKRLLAAGQTGAQIAAATGLSLPSIQASRNPSVWSRPANQPRFDTVFGGAEFHRQG
jgi:hypothetical protein